MQAIITLIRIETRLVESEWSRTETDGDIDGILTILDDVRESGLAYDLDEHTTGISAIGFAFRDWNGDLLAISVPIPSTRFRDSHEKIEDALRKAHRNVEEMISGETD